ncbi:N-6 DNA methylase [Pseudoalteromonas sp. MEBiC 03485]|uniref:restriction endonuclease subunit M n=1 Tax=Pseudoalteromonas sp. MEBiC 03485 TaxID=2571103 RepID=UPI0010211E6F|nr:N-6 DNA methylase [Pseudoalteromonas sp. MEBiC 03485]RZD21556.1 restriction endonuclease subunit M [Pseudoalteromonas sp. MEBiC 03485]
MNLIEQGLAKGYIKFDSEDKKTITYTEQNKSRNYQNPEEQVQAEAYLSLIFEYYYSPKQIRNFVPVTMGSSVREADIVVYNDNACTKPHIIVECKKQEVSEMEFDQAINQGLSYAQALAGTIKYLWVTSQLKNEYFQVDKDRHSRNSITDIPQKGVTKLSPFKYAKNGGVKNGQKLSDLEKVSEADLTSLFKQAHQALWGGGELNPSEAFDELDKLIFCKIWDERADRRSGEPYDFQIITSGELAKTEEEKVKQEKEINESLLKRIHGLYEKGKEKDPEVFKEGVRLNAKKCRAVVSYLEGINLSETDLDSKGRAFETFMGSFFRGDFGQYFTPRPIVKFIVDVLPITNKDKVLDTSCGSGGFLLHALDKVRKQADKRAEDGYYDLDTPKGYKAHFDFWHDFAEKKLFGIEINEQISRTAKMNMIIHDDGHTNVISSDGLLPISRKGLDESYQGDTIQDKTTNGGFEEESFKFVITNPPFGSVVKQTEKAYLHQYRLGNKSVDWLNPKSKAALRPNQSTEVLFIEQDFNFLQEGGYLAVVIPDGILTNTSLKNVRDQIEADFRLVAVVSMPQTAFAANGAGVKSSVLIVKKYSAKKREILKTLKSDIRSKAKTISGFDSEYLRINKEKAEELKSYSGNKEDESFKIWRKELNAKYAEQLDSLKDKTLSVFDELWKAAISENHDYPVFMAIAEDIGFDSTGKETNRNDLVPISVELRKFISSIELEDS